MSGGVPSNAYGSGGSIVLSTGLSSNGGDIKIDGGAKYSGTDGNVLLASTRGNVGIGTTAPVASLDGLLRLQATLIVGSGATV